MVAVISYWTKDGCCYLLMGSVWLMLFLGGLCIVDVIFQGIYKQLECRSMWIKEDKRTINHLIDHPQGRLWPGKCRGRPRLQKCRGQETPHYTFHGFSRCYRQFRVPPAIIRIFQIFPID